MFIFNYLPYLFFSLIFSNVFIIALISLPIFEKLAKGLIFPLNLSFFILTLILFKNLINNFQIKKVSLKNLNWPLLIIGFIIIIYRSITYAHATDDFVLHMIGGYYSLDLWTGKNFIPNILNYLYPIMPLSYYPFLEILGIRLTLIIFYSMVLIWFVSLNARFNYLFFEKEKNKYFYLNLFFIYLFFYPPLILTHVTFMSDFYVIVFALEGLYIFLTNKNKEYGAIMMLIAGLIKQSLGLFILPLFIYFLITNLQNIFKKKLFLLIILLIAIFPIRSYIEIKNPLGGLYNNIFKSPIGEEKHHRDYDLRWGAFSTAEIIYWPLIATFTNRFNEEISVSKIARVIYPPFLFAPYLLSLYLFIKRKKIIFLISFLSILFWSWQSGYGRYGEAMLAIVWIINLYELKKSFFGLNSKITFIFLILFSLFIFPSIRNDYGMRNFFLQRFFPPVLSQYDTLRSLTGLMYIGKDRYFDIYDKLNHNFDDFDAVIIANHGVSTYYAFLAARFKNLPVYSYIDLKRIDLIQKSNLSKKIKQNLNNLFSSKKLLVLTTKDYPGFVEKTWIYKKFNCHILERKKLVPQFIHDNYFNYVVEYSCKK